MMPLVLNFPSVNLVMIGASLTQLMSILSRLRRFLCLSILIAVSGIAQSETVSGGWSNTIDVINSYSAEKALTYDALVQELAFQASEITGLSVPLVCLLCFLFSCFRAVFRLISIVVLSPAFWPAGVLGAVHRVSACRQ